MLSELLTFPSTSSCDLRSDLIVSAVALFSWLLSLSF